MNQVRAKKHLGQHFLRSPDTAGRIAAELSPEYRTLPLAEVGPGMGVLTSFIIGRDAPITLFEIDDESVTYLKANLEMADVRLIEGDFLRMDMNLIFKGEDFRIIGNFPYNISSQIFFKVLEAREQVVEIVGMLQKEVAERITAGPGGKVYGILSVLLQAYYSTQYCFTVEPEEFIPPPKVRSGVIRLTRLPEPRLTCDPVFFKRVVKLAFSTRRKTLRNALKQLLTDEVLRSAPIFDRRAETLSVEEFSQITDLIAGQGK